MFMLINHKNYWVRSKDYVPELKENPETRKLYILNLGIWIQYFKMEKRKKEPTDPTFHIRKRLSEAKQLASLFAKEDWPELYQTIKNLEACLC